MARCDQGYLCRICGEEVEQITESYLYLRYVIGELDPELLHLEPDSHLLCVPAFSQFIEDARFTAPPCSDPLYGKDLFDVTFVKNRTELISEGYRRLWDLRSNRKAPPAVNAYPLDRFLSRWQ